MRQDSFVDEAKHFYTDLINLLVRDEKEKLHVFDKDGLYLATEKIEKTIPRKNRYGRTAKVLRKAAELSEKLHDTRQEQAVPPEPKPIPLPKAQKQPKPQIPPEPEMSAGVII